MGLNYEYMLEKISADRFDVPHNVEGYLFGTPEEISRYKLPKHTALKEINIEAGNSLMLFLKDPYDDDDGFELFKVYAGEVVRAIINLEP